MAIQKFVEYRQAVAAENSQRIADHQAQVKATAAANPLNLLADGDSWFDYPLDGDLPTHTDVIAQLRTQLPGVLILNLAHAGDATLHPNPGGFAAIAAKFVTAIKATFPTNFGSPSS